MLKNTRGSSSRNRQAGAAQRRRPYRPDLEVLEGRCVPAANRIWLGDPNQTSWSVDANWRDNQDQPGRPQAGDQLLFPAAAAGFLSNNDLPAGLTLGSIRVEGSGYLITGNSIKLSNGSDALIAPSTTGFNQLSLGIELLSTPAVVSCANTLRLSGVISGQSLEKRGAGVLEFSGANTYNLGTTIDAGTLRLMANERILDGSAVTIDAGAVLDVNGFTEHIGTLSGGGTIQLDNGHLFAGGSTLSFFSGTIQGPGDFSKDGVGNLILSAVNGMAASTLGVDAGMLLLGNDNVIADNVRVLVFGSAILNLNGQTERIGSLEGGGGVWLGGGQLFAGGSSASTTFSGVMQGAGHFSKEGIGALTLLGANTYTGTLTVDNGTLRLGAPNVIADGTRVMVWAPGTFDLNDRSDTIGALSGDGILKLGTGTLTSGANSQNATFSGPIHGSGGLIKVGTGFWGLEGASDYSGQTIVRDGSLGVGHANALGVANGTLASGTIIEKNASLHLLGCDVGNEALTLTAAGNASSPGALFGSGISSWAGPITLESPSIIFADHAAALTLSGGITGAGGLAIGELGFGADGTVTITGVCDYTGPTTVNLGTLEVNGSLTSPMSVVNDATLAGKGVVAAVILSHDASLSPGTTQSLFPEARLTTGNLTLNADTFLVGIDTGISPFGDPLVHDQVAVQGTVNLSGTHLLVLANRKAPLGAKLTIIDNDGADPVSGIFRDLHEGGAVRTFDDQNFRISYQGGDGNDVVLTRITNFLVTGPDSGVAPRVRVFDATAPYAPKFDFLAYPAGFKGGVRVASADVNGDGFPDIITAPGPGTKAIVKIFSGATAAGQQPQLLGKIKPYGAFRGGAFVAAGGDVNGDGRPDIVVAPGPGIEATVRIYSGRDGAPLHSFRAFPRSFKGGASVAVGDINGDGAVDVIAGMGPGGQPRVRVFAAATGAPLAGPRGDLLAYDAAFAGGVFVAAGDFDGVNFDDIITGPGKGAKPIVKVFPGDASRPVRSVRAYLNRSKFGVHVASADVQGEGTHQILTALGAGGNAEARVFGRDLALVDSLFAESASYRAGLFIAASW